MEAEVSGWKLETLASLFGGELLGQPDVLVTGPAQAGEGGPSSLTFAGDERFLALAEQSSVGAVLIGPDMVSEKPAIRVANPKRSFGQFLAMCARPLAMQVGIHSSASIDPRSHIDPTASVGAFVVIDQDVVVGPGCQVFPHCFVGRGSVLGENVILFPRVTLYQEVSIGARSIVHSGTVLGADGFGYAWDGKQHVKIPQVGRVEIGPDCEIGALSAIDRAMIGVTLIGADTKIDNLVQIGHNTQISDHVVIASLTGIGGSSILGSNVTFGGQAGTADHVKVGDNVIFAGRTAVTVDVPDAGVYQGHPAMPISLSRRITILTRRLPELVKRIKHLEDKLADRESKDQ
ncbi:UDP-3-O-(3-hydroxymyristoyl)glucosamine N-acyltransferase [soil metagenome]